MNARTRNSIPERLGRWAGQVVCKCRRGESWLLQQFRHRGIPRAVSVPLLWISKLLVIGGLLYFTFWVALLLVFGGAVAKLAWASTRDEEDWAIGEQADHKESVFYDPINYTDTPDPRFDDEFDR
ncbi:DUF3742 family protein [Pseudomonas fluorescens]|uniref:DUF3742 family protein n=1 Tax=Pseudomonas fluorescens TaxID=294 RepID=UPI001BE969DA|nr:DUF3742 family protein [Pseudomonas fluorescens]MBT2375352.1 DUF3742 family protein [Pseudomonas fluorescens]